MNSNKNTYIISGAPGTGKSTLIKALRQEGFVCYEEIAREVIKQQKAQGTNILPFNNMEAFSKLVFDEMVMQNQKIKSTFCFIDRSVIDIIGYLKFDRKPVANFYYEELAHFNYNNKVFYTPFWEEIYLNDTERYESMEQAKEIDRCIKQTYIEFGFEIIELPKKQIQDRVQLIKNAIKAQSLI